MTVINDRHKSSYVVKFIQRSSLLVLGCLAIILVLKQNGGVLRPFSSKFSKLYAIDQCEDASLQSSRTACCSNPELPVLGGIDVVDLFYRENDQSLPTLGNPEISAILPTRASNFKFYFLNEGNRQTFLSNPWLFAPAYGGFDAYSIAYDSQYFTPDASERLGPYSDLSVWSIVNGRLYFFGGEGQKKSFITSFSKSSADGNAHWTNFFGYVRDGYFDTNCFRHEEFPDLLAARMTITPKQSLRPAGSTTEIMSFPTDHVIVRNSQGTIIEIDGTPVAIVKFDSEFEMLSPYVMAEPTVTPMPGAPKEQLLLPQETQTRPQTMQQQQPLQPVQQNSQQLRDGLKPWQQQLLAPNPSSAIPQQMPQASQQQSTVSTGQQQLQNSQQQLGAQSMSQPAPQQQQYSQPSQQQYSQPSQQQQYGQPNQQQQIEHQLPQPLGEREQQFVEQTTQQQQQTPQQPAYQQQQYIPQYNMQPQFNQQNQYGQQPAQSQQFSQQMGQLQEFMLQPQEQFSPQSEQLPPQSSSQQPFNQQQYGQQPENPTPAQTQQQQFTPQQQSYTQQNSQQQVFAQQGGQFQQPPQSQNQMRQETSPQSFQQNPQTGSQQTYDYQPDQMRIAQIQQQVSHEAGQFQQESITTGSNPTQQQTNQLPQAAPYPPQQQTAQQQQVDQSISQSALQTLFRNQKAIQPPNPDINLEQLFEKHPTTKLPGDMNAQQAGQTGFQQQPTEPEQYNSQMNYQSQSFEQQYNSPMNYQQQPTDQQYAAQMNYQSQPIEQQYSSQTNYQQQTTEQQYGAQMNYQSQPVQQQQYNPQTNYQQPQANQQQYSPQQYSPQQGYDQNYAPNAQQYNNPYGQYEQEKAKWESSQVGYNQGDSASQLLGQEYALMRFAAQDPGFQGASIEDIYRQMFH